MLYDQANWFQRFMRRVAGIGPVSFLFSLTMHPLDKVVSRLTGGRHTFVSAVSGLPVVMLTTLGAKTGRERTMPVLGIPTGEGDVAVIASNFGKRHQPGWYYNLAAEPTARLSVNGETRAVKAREVTGDERDALWNQALAIYPAWASYEKRASHRTIHIFVLSPDEGPFAAT